MSIPSIIAFEEELAKIASAQNLSAVGALAGIGAGVLAGLLATSRERSSDRLYTDMGHMPAEVARKRGKRRLAVVGGFGAAGGAAGALTPMAKREIAAKIKEVLQPTLEAAENRFAEGMRRGVEKGIDNKRGALGQSIQESMQAASVDVPGLPQVGEMGRLIQERGLWDFLRGRLRGVRAP